MSRYARALGVVFVSGLFVTSACGGESETTSPSGGSGGDTSGASGSGGTSTGGSSGTRSTGGANTGGGGTTASGGDGGTAGTAGSAGTGGGSVDCAGLVCDPVLLPAGLPPIEACCATGNQCGLDGSALEQFGITLVEPCQARDQPGEVDSECASSPPFDAGIGQLVFDGCCTPSGHCGYLIDNAFNLVQIGLGCVDTAVVEGAVPASCTPGG